MALGAAGCAEPSSPSPATVAAPPSADAAQVPPAESVPPADAAQDAEATAQDADAGGPAQELVQHQSAGSLAPPDEPARLLWPLEGKRVLLAGDSMVGGQAGLTRALHERFKGAGVSSFRSDSWVSANLSMFHQQKRFGELLRKQRPDVVLITLGANDAFTIAPDTMIPHVEAIVRKIGDTPCAWLSPPPFRSASIKDSAARFDKFVDMLAAHVAPCRFFDTRKLTVQDKDGATVSAIPRARDSIHPTDAGGAMWAEVVWATLFEP